MNRMVQKRIVLICLLFFVAVIPLLMRLYQLQLTKGKEFARLALRQQTLNVSLEEIERGSIYDRKYRSITNSGYQLRLVFFPELLKNQRDVLKSLSVIIPEAGSDLEKGMNKGKAFVLKGNLTDAQAHRVMQLQLPGVVVAPVRYRYGNQALATNLVGHLGKISSQDELAKLEGLSNKNYKLTDWVGKAGLEKYYEWALKGTKPERMVRAYVDAKHRLINGLGIKQETEAKDIERKNLILTIDADIQRRTEEIMAKHNVSGATVVMQANTGDILALASSPRYNQTQVPQYLRLSEKDPAYKKVFYDRNVLLTYPGSVFKVVVAAAALEKGLVTPETVFKCTPVYGFTCSVPHTDKHNLTDAMAWSCNATFVRLGLELGAEALIKTAKAFGMDSQKVVGYPFARDKNQDWNKLKEPYALVNGSIGQGSVLVNPIQVTGMMNVVANKGIYIQPRLVRELRAADGRLSKIYPLGKSSRAVSLDTAEDLRVMLAKVTTEGTGKDGLVLGWGSAGKTGTAQVDKELGLLNAWFSGFTPLNNPRYVISVLVEDGVSGGKTAAPIFREIADYLKTIE